MLTEIGRREIGISQATAAVLHAMEAEPVLGTDDLAAEAGVNPNDVSAVVTGLELYRQYRNCNLIGQMGIGFSSAWISRLIQAADELGVLEDGVKRVSGRPRVDRERIVEVAENFPSATRFQQAQLAGVSKSRFITNLPADMKGQVSKEDS